MKRGAFLTLMVALLCAMSIDAAVAGVELAVSPAETQVDPGAVFLVELAIPSAMSPFNGYDAVVRYDPTYLTLLPEASPAVREGELMVDACPSARWNRFSVSADSTEISISHVLLCGGVSVTGPGVVYRLRFMAKNVGTVTALELREGTAFYNAGSYVEPVFTQDGTVRIGQATPADPPVPASLGLRAVPNPFNPRTRFAFDLARPGAARLTILSANGRVVRVIDCGWLEAGAQAIPWDGLDARGSSVASGNYFAHLRHRDGEAVCGAVLIQ